jgi:hypothetical protein
VVTAFVVEAYQRLEPNSQDETAQIPLRISQQLSDRSVPESTLSDFSPTARDVRVNVLWFLSLVLSLSAAVLGLICKQWLRQYQRDASVTPQEAIKIRRLRYGGYRQWKVLKLLELLPELLQTSVILFFVGVVDFVWGLHSTLAIILTGTIGLFLLLVSALTLAPSFYYSQTLDANSIFPCPYKSTWAHAFLRHLNAAGHILDLLRIVFLRHVLTRQRPPLRGRNWLVIERAVLEEMESPYYNCSHIYKAIKDLKETFRFNPPVVTQLFHCLQSPTFEIPSLIGRAHQSDCPIHGLRKEMPRSVINWWLLWDLFPTNKGHIPTGLELGLRALNDFCSVCHHPPDGSVVAPLTGVRSLLNDSTQTITHGS